MARYGVDRYGVAYYGAQALIDFDASPFTATSRVTGGLLLRWTQPGGNYDRLRLVRNAYGNPINVDDGQILLNTEDTSLTELADSGLTEGVWYYYSLFVREPVGLGFVWRRAGDTAGLVSAGHGYSRLLLDRLPSQLTTDPREAGGQADEGSLLGRFLGVFGFELDAMRTTLGSLRDTKDADKVPGRLLPLLAQQLGQVYEPEIGMAQNRVLLRNTTYLYKTKGTRPCLEGLASSITGWAASLMYTPNLLLHADDSSAEVTTGTWVVSGPGALTRRPSAPADEVGGVRGYTSFATQAPNAALFQLTASAAGRVELRLPGGLGGVPLQGASSVTWSVFVRHATTSRAPRLALGFYDLAGREISRTPEQAGASTTNGWDVRLTLTAPVPEGAWFAQPVLIYPTLATGEVQYFDAAQVEAGTAASPFSPARDLRIWLEPNRRNLVPNPGFEANTSGWLATGGSATLARDTTVTHDNSSASGRLTTTTGAGRAYAALSAVVGQTYTASAWVRGTGVVRLDWRSAPGGGAVEALSPDLVLSDTWQRISLVHTASTATPSINVRLAAAGTAFIDSVLVERGSDLGTYFDGATRTGESGWEGTPNASPSVYYTQRPIRDNALRRNLPRYLPMASTFTLVYADGYRT